MTPEHLAKEAERLSRDDVLKRALADLKQEALINLSMADPEQVAQIIGFQQRALIADEILDQLQRYILALAE